MRCFRKLLPILEEQYLLSNGYKTEEENHSLPLDYSYTDSKNGLPNGNVTGPLPTSTSTEIFLKAFFFLSVCKIIPCPHQRRLCAVLCPYEYSVTVENTNICKPVGGHNTHKQGIDISVP